MTRPPVPRRSMTPDEAAMATALGMCRVLPATFERRFIARVAAAARDPLPEISDREALTVRRLVHRYRRQIRPDVVALAGERPPAPWDASSAAAPAAPPPPTSPAATPQLSLLEEAS